MILIIGGKGYVGVNLGKYLSSQNIKYETVDLVDGEHAENITAKYITEFSGIVHLAALSGIKACEDNPALAMRNNLFAASNIFMEATKAGIPVVFTSSQATKNPASSSYAMQKRLCEMVAEQLNTQGGKITVLRLTNVYGGEKYLEKKNTVIKQFLTAYKADKPFIIDGEGEQKRDFIHVEDVCRVLLMALKKPYTSMPVDIGTGIGTSILDLVKIFPEHPVRYSDERQSGVESNIADVLPAWNIWGFEAKPRMKEYILRISEA
jgi:UDP-glucose 4-epimerase